MRHDHGRGLGPGLLELLEFGDRTGEDDLDIGVRPPLALQIEQPHLTMIRIDPIARNLLSVNPKPVDPDGDVTEQCGIGKDPVSHESASSARTSRRSSRTRARLTSTGYVSGSLTAVNLTVRAPSSVRSLFSVT